jgi:dolichol kinase
MSDEDVVQNDCMNDVEIMRARWKNRRRMAWLSLLSMITVTCLILFTKIVPETRLVILSDVITWFYFSCASIIGMYMGATTWASVKGK